MVFVQKELLTAHKYAPKLDLRLYLYKNSAIQHYPTWQSSVLDPQQANEETQQRKKKPHKVQNLISIKFHI